MANYIDVTWTGGDTITEAKMDNMVSNDRAEDAHAAGVHLNNNASIKGTDSGSTLYNLIKMNSADEIEIGESGVDRIVFVNLRQEEEYDNGNSGASKTINWKNGSYQKITLTANCTLTFSNVAAGDVLNLRVVQDGTGGYDITWPATTKAKNGSVIIANGASEETWLALKAVGSSEFHIVGQARDMETVS